MTDFNDTYGFKKNSTDTIRVYMLAKEDWGINVVLLRNEKK